MGIDKLLAGLSKVRATHPGEWVACCPAHSDKNPSLAIRKCDNGKILLKCWAGCSVSDIVGSVGLELGDLFPDMPKHHSKPARNYFAASTVLKSLRMPLCILSVAGHDLRNKKHISEGNLAEINKALAQIDMALSYTDL